MPTRCLKFLFSFCQFHRYPFLNPGQVSALRGKLRPHMLRRMKKDVFKDMPVKEETLVPVSLAPFQREFYQRATEVFVSLIGCCNSSLLFFVGLLVRNMDLLTCKLQASATVGFSSPAKEAIFFLL